MDLKFTVINCEGVKIKKEYKTLKDFYNELESEEIDGALMLDDEIENLIVFGGDMGAAKGTTVSDIADYLKVCI